MSSSRRAFLGQISTAVAGAGVSSLLVEQALAADPASPPRKLAIVTTEWTIGTHAWHMAERFLVGYPREGRWHACVCEAAGAVLTP